MSEKAKKPEAEGRETVVEEAEAPEPVVRVTLMASRAGVGFSQNRGDTVLIPQSEALRMIEAGQAVPVSGEPGVETR